MLATVIDCIKSTLLPNYWHVSNVSVFENNLFIHPAEVQDEVILIQQWSLDYNDVRMYLILAV